MPDLGDDVVDGGVGTDTLVVDYSNLSTRAVAWRENNPNPFVWDVYVGNAYGIGTPVRIAANQFSYYDAALSADGTKVAWLDVDPVDGQNKVFVKTLTGFDSSGSLVKISVPGFQVAAGHNLSLSGDGSKVTFVCSDGYDTEIFVANTDGTGVTQITNNDFNDGDFRITISSDGTKVAWSIPSLNGNGQEIFVANTDGTGIKQISDDPEPLAPAFYPSLSADGSKVAWMGRGVDNKRAILIANTDGTGIRQVSPPGYSAYYPSLSGDGSKVSWVGGIDNVGFGTFVGNTSSFGGKSPVYIPTTNNGNFSSLSGDGEKVAFFASNSTNSDIRSLFVANADGTGTLTTIDTGTSSYGNGELSLSTYVNIGSRYLSFDPITGSGEIATWGESRIRFSNIEQFNLIGSRYGDELRGGNMIDSLTGGAGDDTLNGGGGADELKGDEGNDTYIVDNVGDVVNETSIVATEIDTVQSSITYTLNANVENLTLTGTTAINGTGNSLNNTIIGNSANNTLNGDAGDDTVNGSGGNDTIDGSAGNDTINGGTGNDNITGGAGNDNITGGGGADILKAGLGNDTYILSASTAGGTQLQDEGNTDSLNLTDINLSLAMPKAGLVGLQRDNTTLRVDLNADGVINVAEDLVILDFFAASGTGAGRSLIETIDNLTSSTILNFFAVNQPHDPDFNSNSQSDIIWRNEATGANSIWLMNGTALAQGITK